MSESNNTKVLKHGAYSEIPLLPGEDPEEFQKLKEGLVAEYKPSGISEEMDLIEIGKSHWQERPYSVYQRAQLLRAKKQKDMEPNPLAASILGWELGRPPTAAEIEARSSKTTSTGAGT